MMIGNAHTLANFDFSIIIAALSVYASPCGSFQLVCCCYVCNEPSFTAFELELESFGNEPGLHEVTPGPHR